MESIQQTLNSLYESTFKEDNFTGIGSTLFIIWIIRALVYTFVLPFLYKSQYAKVNKKITHLDKTVSNYETKHEELDGEERHIETKYINHNLSFRSIFSNITSYLWELMLILHFITPSEYHPLWIVLTIIAIIRLIMYDIMIKPPKAINDIREKRTEVLNKLRNFYKNTLSNNELHEKLSNLVQSAPSPA